MDITKNINEIVDKVKNDKNFAKKFQKDPIKAVEDVIGLDLPDDQIMNVVEVVKSKVSADKTGDMIKGLFNK